MPPTAGHKRCPGRLLVRSSKALAQSDGACPHLREEGIPGDQGRDPPFIPHDCRRSSVSELLLILSTIRRRRRRRHDPAPSRPNTSMWPPQCAKTASPRPQSVASTAVRLECWDH
jgi:hypothetical protein